MGRFYRINEKITAGQLRVIGADGSQIGVISRDEALKLAKNEELDLVVVAENANPPVARIIEFKKFRYQEDKKEQAARKKARDVELKEVWLSPRIAAHDLETRLRKAEEFLEKGNKVKLTIKFKGREMAHPENGHKVLQQVLGLWEDKIVIEREAKFEGRNLTIIVGANKQV